MIQVFVSLLLFQFALCQKWTQVNVTGSSIPATYGHIAVIEPLSGDMIIAGGASRTQNIWRLSFTTNTWSIISVLGTIQAPGKDRAVGVVEPVSGDMVLFGGDDSTGRSNTLWRFSFTSRSWTLVTPSTPYAPNGRIRSTGQINPATGDLIIFGGWDGAQVEHNDLWSFSFAQNKWTLLNATSGSLPQAREGATSQFNLQGEFVVFGGYSVPFYYNDVWAFSFTLLKWRTVNSGSGTAPSVRDQMTSVLLPSGEFIMCAGHRYPDSYNDVWNLTFGMNQWTQLQPAGPLPPYRDMATAVLDPKSGDLVLFGGIDTTGASIPLNDVWRLSFPQAVRILPPSASSVQSTTAQSSTTLTVGLSSYITVQSLSSTQIDLGQPSSTQSEAPQSSVARLSEGVPDVIIYDGETASTRLTRGTLGTAAQDTSSSFIQSQFFMYVLGGAAGVLALILFVRLWVKLRGRKKTKATSGIQNTTMVVDETKATFSESTTYMTQTTSS